MSHIVAIQATLPPGTGCRVKFLPDKQTKTGALFLPRDPSAPVLVSSGKREDRPLICFGQTEYKGTHPCENPTVKMMQAAGCLGQ